MTADQVELEKQNNVSGLLGALEKETFSSYFGLVGGTKAITAKWQSFGSSLMKPILPYAAGMLAPVLMLFFTRAPHGKDGSSLKFGRTYRKALGLKPYLHGDEIGPLDLSVYGTFACFLYLRSPVANYVLDTCDLRDWYVRVDTAVNAIKPLL